MSFIIRECFRANWCVDCDDNKCVHHGKIGADCPKWKCDNENTLDCENCDFIKELYVIDHKHQIKDQADMVSVVRCKDCIHWKTDSHCEGYRSAEDFCSWGERKE